jgi:hypothetical protein
MKLSDTIFGIIEDVKNLTGKGVEFTKNLDLNNDAEAKLAHHLPAHIILYKDENKMDDHLIAHELGHIIIIYSTPEEKRLIPRQPDKEDMLRALSQVYSFLKAKNMDEKELLDTFYQWHYIATVNLIYNIQDSTVENWIYDNYPALKSLQLKRLKLILEESLERMKNLSPLEVHPELVRIDNILQYIYYRRIGRHIGENLTKGFNHIQSLEEAKRLTEYIERNHDGRYESDIKITNYLAEVFHMRHWIKWKDWNDIPENYATIINGTHHKMLDPRAN